MAGGIDIESLKEWVTYDPASGEFFWRKNRGAVKAGSRAGTPTGTGHRRIIILGIRFLEHRLAFAFVHGQWPEFEIDHKNGNQADNRLENLRPATHRQNIRNRKINSNNTSGFKGVSLHKQTGKWCARIKTDTKYASLGLFATPEAAHTAYVVASAEYHGQFGRVF